MALDAAKLRAKVELELKEEAYEMLGHRATFQSKLDLMTAKQEFEQLEQSQERELLETKHELNLQITHPLETPKVQIEQAHEMLDAEKKWTKESIETQTDINQFSTVYKAAQAQA